MDAVPEDAGENGQRIVFANEMAAPLPPIAWVCESLRIAPGRPTMIAGYGASRKTWLAQSLALSKAAGQDVVGVYRCLKGRALHLDFEQGRRLTFERYQRLARAMGVDLGQLGESLGYAWSPETFRDVGAADALARLVDGFDLCIVDPLRAACPGVDENSSDARGPLDVMTKASELTGHTAFVVLDHSGKPPPDGSARARKHAPRGSSAKFDACQVVFVLSGEKGQPTLITCEKESLTGCFAADFLLTVEDVERDGDPRWGARLVHLDKEQLPAPPSAAEKRAADVERIRNFLRENGGRFAGSREALRSSLAMRRDPFNVAFGTMQQGTSPEIVREGTYRHGTWVSRQH